MNKKELQDILKSNGIKNYSRMNKTELKKYIKEKLNIDVDEDKKEKKKKDINYGITPLKYGERRPTEIEALKKNQVRYWGLNKLDDSFIKKAKVQGNAAKLKQRLVELTAQMKGITNAIKKETDEEKKKKLQEKAKKFITEYKKIKQDLEGTEEKKGKEEKENIPSMMAQQIVNKALKEIETKEKEKKIPSMVMQDIVNRALKEIETKEKSKVKKPKIQDFKPNIELPEIEYFGDNIKGVEGLKLRAKAKKKGEKVKMGTLKLKTKKNIVKKYADELDKSKEIIKPPSRFKVYSELFAKELARDKRRAKLQDERFYKIQGSLKSKLDKSKLDKGTDKPFFF